MKSKLFKAVLAATAVFSPLFSSFTAVSAQEEASDYVVKIAMRSEIDSLDPLIAAATDTGTMLANMHDGLVDYDTEGVIIPSIAESWEISDDNLTYTFTLKEGITFHDGSELTAEDVVASYSPLAGLDGESAGSSKWEVVESIEALDDFTVAITLSSIDSGFLARTTAAIMPSEYDDQASHPIGAGPFKFTSWNPGESLVMERNDDYYDEENMPQIAGAEWLLMQDNATTTLALQTGEIDITGVSLEDKAMLGDNFNYLEGPQNMVVIFGLNHEHEDFQDPLVRQAINHAINKQELIDIVFSGNAVELGSMFSPAMEFYYQEGLQETWPYDPERAMELLAEAGKEDLTFTIKTPSHAQFYLDSVQVIVDQLAQVGITAEIEAVEWSTWLEEVYTDFDHEATIIGLTGKIDPYDVLIRFNEGYSRNFINYNNEDYNTAIANAVQELDDDQRATYYKEAQTILAEDASSVFLMDPNRTTAMQPQISGLEEFPAQKYNLEDIVISEE